MPKKHSQFVCQQCEASFPKWQGQCNDCKAWNTLVEEAVLSKSEANIANIRGIDEIVTTFPEVKLVETTKNRFSTTMEELDRVLGGGLVPGMVTLVGGEPGIGKSTLLTQVVVGLLTAPEQKKHLSGEVLYVSGEESPSQISIRVNRYLEKEQKNSSGKVIKSDPKKKLKNLVFVTSTNVEEVVSVMTKRKPSLVVIDSIQTMRTAELTGASGSVGQIRQSTEKITQIAKALHIPVFFVGHVTKDGAIAGPKVLEHIVDAVIEISGERSGQLRLVRALKNRFGATDEVGVFQHDDYGLAEVKNPSELFLEQAAQDVPGSATVCVMEGTRPLLIEVQALVNYSQLAMPRRVGRGIELSRIQVLAAVLQKHAKLPLDSNDVFLNAAGGFKIKEPAVDLGLAVAIASSLKNKKIPRKIIFIGEVGLLGEIRKVSFLEKRKKEAKRLGFSKIFSKETHGTVKEVLQDLGLL
ncbi:MAG: DNA repair protein RadA [Candidatus Pacebacteria bacterium]|nr:DNA repair protein RadA [Candidatus Paceibacterota bacterium]MBT4652802.1 DNA repair protein RadA [Candidatus Paceibacterota bacterium]MBT6755790.1 DNA repair protein RadA [Candidatus Paceibacterota bacterium]MBT6921768.1 DNA repair protein RadA [Candidatus Paceibacterota bacterium]